jgi:hypothetical protein
MKSLLVTLVVVLVFGVQLLSVDRGQGRTSDAREGRNRTAEGSERGRAGVPLFSAHDVGIIRAHYASDARLPRGLQKKLARGGSLPPGWEKKLERFPAPLERQLLVLPTGHARGVMDGHAVIYNPITHAILDIVSLF